MLLQGIENGDIEFQKRGSKFLDPRSSRPEDVHPSHFKEARLYDNQIREDGWQVDRSFARKNYRSWLNNIRQHKKYNNFRRQYIDIYVDVELENGEFITVKRSVINDEDEK